MPPVTAIGIKTEKQTRLLAMGKDEAKCLFLAGLPSVRKPVYTVRATFGVKKADP